MKTQPKRKTKEFWMVTEDGPELHTGYSCAPLNRGVWWFASLGYSCSVCGTFKTRKAAMQACISKAHKEVFDSLEHLHKMLQIEP